MKPGSRGVVVAQIVMAVAFGLFPVAVWAFGINGASASRSGSVIEQWLAPWAFGVFIGVASLLLLAVRGALAIPTDPAEMARMKERTMGTGRLVAAIAIPAVPITAALFGPDIRISIASFGFGYLVALMPYQVYAAWVQYRASHPSH